MKKPRFFYMPDGGSPAGGQAGGAMTSGYGGGGGGGAMSGIFGMASTIINAATARKANKDQQDFWWQTYDKQREHALADRDFANDYNSPVNQMKRLEEAGLNRLLITGGQQSVPSSNVGSSSGGRYDHKTPNVDMQGIFLDALAADRTETQTAMANKQMEVMDHQIGNIDANTRATLVSAGLKEFDLGIKNEVQNTDGLNFTPYGYAEHNRLQMKSVQLDQATENLAQAYLMNPKNIELATSKVIGAALDNKMKELNISKVPLEQEKLREEINYLKSNRALTDLKSELAKIDLKYRDAEKITGAVSRIVNTFTGALPKTVRGIVSGGGGKKWDGKIQRYHKVDTRTGEIVD